MINWRTIVGVILLFFGIKQLYIIINNAGVVTGGTNTLSSEVACGVWMLVGIYFIIRGITMKKTS